MRLGDKFFELSSEGRQEIVRSLLDDPKRHTQIASELGMTPGEVTRNLQRLMDSDFVIKCPDTKYQVTKYGQFILEQLRAIDYLEQNLDFFNTHDLSCIPGEFISPQVLSNAEIIKGTPRVMSHIWQLTETSDDFMLSIIDTPLKPIISENVKKVKDGVVLKTIVRDPGDVPAEYVGIFGVSLDIRYLDNVNLYLKSNEKKLILALPDINGDIDYSEALISESPAFLNWGRLLYEHFWNQARPISL